MYSSVYIEFISAKKKRKHQNRTTNIQCGNESNDENSKQTVTLKPLQFKRAARDFVFTIRFKILLRKTEHTHDFFLLVFFFFKRTNEL